MNIYASCHLTCSSSKKNEHLYWPCTLHNRPAIKVCLIPYGTVVSSYFYHFLFCGWWFHPGFKWKALLLLFKESTFQLNMTNINISGANRLKYKGQWYTNWEVPLPRRPQPRDYDGTWLAPTMSLLASYAILVSVISELWVRAISWS